LTTIILLTLLIDGRRKIDVAKCNKQ